MSKSQNIMLVSKKSKKKIIIAIIAVILVAVDQIVLADSICPVTVTL